MHVLLASRDEKRGQQAVKQLQDEGLPVEAIVLDVDSQPSIQQAADSVRRQHGGLDILVNNAGIAFKGDAFDEQVARATIGTNYYGTRHMLSAFSPLMRDGGRVVNVSSMAGRNALRGMSEQRRQQMLKPDLSPTELDGLMEEFIGDVKRGDWKEKGWPKSAYGVSKVSCTRSRPRVTALLHGCAEMLRDESLLCDGRACCCSGWRDDADEDQRAGTTRTNQVRQQRSCALPSALPPHRR